jgi:hypothetical protein
MLSKMNASSIAFHLHSTLAYEKSISTIGASKLDSNRGRGLLALAFALSVVVSAGAAQPGQQSQNQLSSPVNKPKQPAQTLSDSEILEARELLDQLGYWVNLEATGSDVSLRHALIAFEKIEGRERTGVLTVEELEAFRETLIRR